MIGLWPTGRLGESFDGAGAPPEAEAVGDGVLVAAQALTNERSAGSPVASAAAIQDSSSLRPRRSFIMAAKARALAATAASSGDAARIASRLALSLQASWSGLVMIQLVTALTFGTVGSGPATVIV